MLFQKIETYSRVICNSLNQNEPNNYVAVYENPVDKPGLSECNGMGAC